MKDVQQQHIITINIIGYIRTAVDCATIILLLYVRVVWATHDAARDVIREARMIHNT